MKIIETVIQVFSGLRKEYYFRHLFFGTIICALMLWFVSTLENRTDQLFLFVLFYVVNTLLYPYARFVYESIMKFIFGDNIFLVNAIWFLIVKTIMMILCWQFAIFIAPIGLIYIYYYQKKQP